MRRHMDQLMRRWRRILFVSAHFHPNAFQPSSQASLQMGQEQGKSYSPNKRRTLCLDQRSAECNQNLPGDKNKTPNTDLVHCHASQGLNLYHTVQAPDKIFIALPSCKLHYCVSPKYLPQSL